MGRHATTNTTWIRQVGTPTPHPIHKRHTTNTIHTTQHIFSQLTQTIYTHQHLTSVLGISYWSSYHITPQHDMWHASGICFQNHIWPPPNHNYIPHTHNKQQHRPTFITDTMEDGRKWWDMDKIQGRIGGAIAWMDTQMGIIQHSDIYSHHTTRTRHVLSTTDWYHDKHRTWYNRDGTDYR